jgi:hypothetical protein
MHLQAAMPETEKKPEWWDRTNIGYPFHPSRLISTVRGAENFHIYLWVAKDIGSLPSYDAFQAMLTVMSTYYFHRMGSELAYVGTILRMLCYHLVRSTSVPCLRACFF